MATLPELIKHYENDSLPKPAYATLCALRRFALIEECSYAVRFKGVILAAFRSKKRAEQFAELGRRDTPGDDPIEVVDIAFIEESTNEAS